MKMVSVWMTTYNHEGFIAEAIEGVMMQETNFSFELVIGEDCSTDTTRQIVLAYKEKYPDKIRLFLPENNLGMIAMSTATFELCDGKYVALLDGDDYWTDPYKLQKQVDFMEKNPNFVLCFHKVYVLNQVSGRFSESAYPAYINSDNTLSQNHFINEGNPIHTLSALYRNGAIEERLPNWFSNLPFLDLGLYLLLIKNGKVKYLDEVMGVYRVHTGGAWTSESRSKNYLRLIIFWKQVRIYLPYLDKTKIDRLIAKCYLKLAELDESTNKGNSTGIYLQSVLKYDKVLVLRKKRKFLKLLLSIYFKNPLKYILSRASK